MAVAALDDPHVSDVDGQHGLERSLATDDRIEFSNRCYRDHAPGSISEPPEGIVLESIEIQIEIVQMGSTGKVGGSNRRFVSNLSGSPSL